MFTYYHVMILFDYSGRWISQQATTIGFCCGVAIWTLMLNIGSITSLIVVGVSLVVLLLLMDHIKSSRDNISPNVIFLNLNCILNNNFPWNFHPYEHEYFLSMNSPVRYLPIIIVLTCLVIFRIIRELQVLRSEKQ